MSTQWIEAKEHFYKIFGYLAYRNLNPKKGLGAYGIKVDIPEPQDDDEKEYYEDVKKFILENGGIFR
jgi:hypothetical protein